MEKRERCIHFYSVCTVAIVVLSFCTIPVPMSIFLLSDFVQGVTSPSSTNHAVVVGLGNLVLLSY